MNNVRFEVAPDGIALATIDMPGRPFNVFSDEMIDELEQLTAHIEADAAIRGVVVTSGKEAFMAGADLAMVRGFTTLRLEKPAEEIRAVFPRLNYALRRFERLTVPTVAAINGLALGGGLEFAMACHHRVAVDGGPPGLGLPEILLGLFPGAGGTQRLPRLTTPAFAARMLLDGKPVSPAVAHAAGLVDHLAPAPQLLDSARAIARQARAGARWDHAGWQLPADPESLLAGDDVLEKLLALAWMGPRVAHLYPAVGAVCRSLLDGWGKPIDAAIEVEVENFLTIMLDPVAGNMVRTSFLSRTAAPKRAARQLDAADGGVRALCVSGAAPARLAAHFELVDELARADATLAVDAPGGAVRAEFAIGLRAVDAPPTGCAAEIRYVGDFDAVEAVEIAAAPGELASRALAIARRLRLTPVATAPGEAGPLARLLAAVRRAAAVHAPDAAKRGALANALDLGALFARAGLACVARDGFTVADRAAGLALLREVAGEAASCLAEGLLATAEDADVLAVAALGFPAWSGGPLSLLDMIARGEVDGLPAAPGATPALFYPE